MKEFRTGNVQSFSVEPFGGEPVTVSVSASDFASPPAQKAKQRGKTPPDAYLIFGFDTEYQTSKAATVQDILMLLSEKWPRHMEAFSAVCAVARDDHHF